MEGLFMHGAAHVHFENKLADMETRFDSRILKLEKKFKKEMKEVFRVQMDEMRKLRKETRMLTDEVADIKQSEEDISKFGMNHIRRLSKDVKDEVHDIKRIKNQVKHIKTEITDIKKVEEDISHEGMDQISKLNKELKTEIRDLKSQINVLKIKPPQADNLENRESGNIDSKLQLMNISKEDFEAFLLETMTSFLQKSDNNNSVKPLKKREESSSELSSMADSSNESSKNPDSLFSSQESHLECEIPVNKMNDERDSPLLEMPDENEENRMNGQNIENDVDDHKVQKKQFIQMLQK